MLVASTTLAGCGQENVKVLNFGPRQWSIASDYQNYYLQAGDIGDSTTKALAFSTRPVDDTSHDVFDTVVISAYDAQFADTAAMQDAFGRNIVHVLGYTLLKEGFLDTACPSTRVWYHFFSFSDDAVAETSYLATQAYLLDQGTSYVINFVSPSKKTHKAFRKRLGLLACES